MEYRYQVGDRIVSVQLERADDLWRASVDGGAWLTLHIVTHMGNFLELELNGKRTCIHIARDGDKRFVARGSDAYEFTKVERGSERSRNHDTDGDTLEATMPGQVVVVAVKEGESVERGQTLVVLEAMKMELRVTAPHDGVVRRIHVEAGQVVERGQVIAELE